MKTDIEILYDPDHTSLLNIERKQPDRAHAPESLNSQRSVVDNALRRAIYQHLLFNGYYSLAEKYEDRLNPTSSGDPKQGGLEVYHTLDGIIESMNHRNIKPALSWLEQQLIKNKDALNSSIGESNLYSSTNAQQVELQHLIFELHTLHFLEIIHKYSADGNQYDDRKLKIKTALSYARNNFSHFASSHINGTFISSI